MFVTDDLIGLNCGIYRFGSFGIGYCVMCEGGNFVSGIRLSSSMDCVCMKLSLCGNFRSNSCKASTAF